MTATLSEKMAALPKSEDLGTYVAETNRLKAELHLNAKIIHLGTISSGNDCYEAEVKFSAPKMYREDKEGFSVTCKYSSNIWEEIIARLKAAESGIEQLLRGGAGPHHKWTEERRVMRCILELEDQINPLYETRVKAKKERNVLIYGKEDLRDDD